MAFFAPSFSDLMKPLSDEKLSRILGVMPAGCFTLKKTGGNRLKDLDEAIVSHLDLLPAGRIRIHDMASSTGITSLELYDRLSAIRAVNMRSSDLYDAVFVAKRG